jgi:hypothetical protein
MLVKMNRTSAFSKGNSEAQVHNAAQDRRLLMPGVPHRQGSRNLAAYRQA